MLVLVNILVETGNYPISSLSLDKLPDHNLMFF